MEQAQLPAGEAEERLTKSGTRRPVVVLSGNGGNAMNGNMMPYVYGWAVLAVIVVVLALRRIRVARHDDTTVHLADTEAALVTQQAAVGRQLRAIDRWGQWLTVIAVLYGLTLLGIYFYGVWLAGNKPVL